jgi:hypothetical protein
VHQIIPITEEEFGANSAVRSAVVSDPWVLLVLDSGKVVVFSMNPKSKDMDVHPQMTKVNVSPRWCIVSDIRASLFVDLFSKGRNRISCLWKLLLDRIPWSLVRLPSNGSEMTTMMWIYMVTRK